MITLYGKEGCGYCTKAKALLLQHDINFVEIRIDEDADAKAFILEEGHKTVPQLYVGDMLLVEGGYTGLAALPKSLIELRVQELKG
jgi:glutaredoxin